MSYKLQGRWSKPPITLRFGKRCQHVTGGEACAFMLAFHPLSLAQLFASCTALSVIRSTCLANVMLCHTSRSAESLEALGSCKRTKPLKLHKSPLISSSIRTAHTSGLPCVIQVTETPYAWKLRSCIKDNRVVFARRLSTRYLMI